MLNESSAHMLKGSCGSHFKKRLHPILYRTCNLVCVCDAEIAMLRFEDGKTGKEETFVTVKMYKVFIYTCTQNNVEYIHIKAGGNHF